MENWQALLVAYVLGVLSNISTPYIRKASRYVYLTLKTWLIKAVKAFCRASSKAYSLAVDKLSIDYFVGKVVQGFSFLLIGVCKVAYVGAFLFLINYHLNRITGHTNTVVPNAYANSQADTCYCPTPTNSIYSKSVIRPERQVSVLPYDCPRPYGIRPQYPAKSVLYTTERTRVGDCSPARKGRKIKGVVYPCTIDSTVSIGGYSTPYNVDDSPQ
jgi:hypothetical protein